MKEELTFVSSRVWKEDELTFIRGVWLVSRFRSILVLANATAAGYAIIWL